MLKDFCSPSAYFPRDSIRTKEIQLHGFCDALEVAYLGVVYVSFSKNENGCQSQGLELCGTVILAKLLHYVAKILNVPSSNVFAWKASCVSLESLQGN